VKHGFFIIGIFNVSALLMAMEELRENGSAHKENGFARIGAVAQLPHMKAHDLANPVQERLFKAALQYGLMHGHELYLKHVKELSFLPINITVNACAHISNKLQEKEYSVDRIEKEIDDEYRRFMLCELPIKMPCDRRFVYDELPFNAAHLFFGLIHFNELKQKVLRQEGRCVDCFFDASKKIIFSRGKGQMTTEFEVIQKMFITQDSKRK
jgi:hypothetical protein